MKKIIVDTREYKFVNIDCEKQKEDLTIPRDKILYLRQDTKPNKEYMYRSVLGLVDGSTVTMWFEEDNEGHCGF